MHAEYTSPGSSSQPSLTPSTCGVYLLPNSPSLSSSTHLRTSCANSIFRCRGTYRSALESLPSPSRRRSLASLSLPPYLSLGPSSRSLSRSLIPAKCDAPRTQCRRSRCNRGTQFAHPATRIFLPHASVRSDHRLQCALSPFALPHACTQYPKPRYGESLYCIVLRAPDCLHKTCTVDTFFTWCYATSRALFSATFSWPCGVTRNPLRPSRITSTITFLLSPSTYRLCVALGLPCVRHSPTHGNHLRHCTPFALGSRVLYAPLRPSLVT